MRSIGQLTLVGVGPGDPSLLTLAAVKAIKEADIITYPISEKSQSSIALSIAINWIDSGKEKIPLIFPMVKDSRALKNAWRIASDRVAILLDQGNNITFICEGDVSLFATGSYLLLEMKKSYPQFDVQIVPGVTSISAAAASGLWPLSLQNEQLLISPTPDSPKMLGELLNEAFEGQRIYALLKLGNRWSWVKPLLEKKGILKYCLFAQRIGLPDQKISAASHVSKDDCPYFSLLLIRTRWPEFIP